MINIDKIEVNVAYSGHITNCYLVYDENNDAILIDPGYESDKIIEEIRTKRCHVKYIVITHSHSDHMGALAKVAEYTNAKIIVHVKDLEALLDKQENYADMLNVEKQNIDENIVMTVKDGDTIIAGTLEFEVIHTPGHTAGSICLLEKNSQKFFTGDTIFSDCYGRCDLYSGSIDDMAKSLRKVFARFESIMIYPGHGESTNLSKAKRYIKMLMAMKNIKV
ncbi:MAG: MBL fold metallo-hydrolase [Clostridia bacterium]|nr:MBL fold metallo-hydrolase [Clostridia bacterium]